MASKGSKIPKLSKSNTPNSSSSDAGQNQGTRTNAVSTFKRNTPLSSPRHASQVPPLRASPTMHTPKRAVPIKSPRKPPSVQNNARPSLNENVAASGDLKQVVETERKSVIPDLMAGATDKSNGVVSDPYNDSLQKFSHTNSPTVEIPKDIKGNNYIEETTEVDNALKGLIMPTSEHEFSNYLHLTSIPEEKDGVTNSWNEPLVQEVQIQPAVTANEIKCVSQRESDDVSASTESAPATLQFPNCFRNISHDSLFDVTTFSQCIENNYELPETVKSKIFSHAESYVNELTMAAAQKSVPFLIDFEKFAGMALDNMNGYMDHSFESDSMQNCGGPETLSPHIANVNNVSGNETMHDVLENEDMVNSEIVFNEPLVTIQEMTEDDDINETVLLPEAKPSLVQLQTKPPPYFNQYHKSLSNIAPEHAKMKDNERSCNFPSTKENDTPEKLAATAEDNANVDVLYETSCGIVRSNSCASTLPGEVETCEAEEVNDVAKLVSENTPVLLGPPVEHDSEDEIDIIQFAPDSDNETEVEDERQVENMFTALMGQENCNRTGSNKKAKTIFSVDVPMTQVKVQSGPGENGDGRGVHSPITLSKENATTETPFISSAMQSARKTVTDVDEDGYYNMRQEIPPRKAVSCSVKENKSAPNMSTAATEVTPMLETECRALLPKNLILQQDYTKKNVFCKIVPIHNPTSSLYAFKVCCGQFPSTHFTASPDIGLLRPNRKVFVEIKASNVRKGNKEVLLNGMIKIKIFPTCISENDPDRLEKVYQRLCMQCPELIHTQTPNRVIIWESSNLKRNLEFLNSIEDDEERRSLKKYLHDCQSGSTLVGTKSCHSNMSNRSENESTQTLLRSIREQLGIANGHLKETFQEILALQNTQSVTLFLCVLILIVAVAGPLRHLMEEPKPEIQIQDSWYEKMLKGLYLK